PAPKSSARLTTAGVGVGAGCAAGAGAHVSSFAVVPHATFATAGTPGAAGGGVPCCGGATGWDAGAVSDCTQRDSTGPASPSAMHSVPTMLFIDCLLVGS